MGLADILSDRTSTPWCFVNPSFFFGDESSRSWKDDWYGRHIPRLARDCFLPLAKRASLVLHATDPEFDYPTKHLPDRHYFVGFLQWEPNLELPNYLDSPGAPWALITLSSVWQEDEQALARSALDALSHRNVRSLLTQPDREIEDELGAIPSNAKIERFVPHSPVLKQSSIVINHAGHGIVSKAIELGVPMVLMPWDRDQPGVAARAEKLGVAYVIPRHSAQPDKVAIGVNAVLDSPDYREAADHHARRLAQTDPFGLATSLIENM
jgi:UDP:flavonoid glycosyltransferase YjiC (YdhE family)